MEKSLFRPYNVRVFMVTISPAIFFTCYDFFIRSKEVTVITIQQTFLLVCRRTNKYFVAV
jgi:hypothetical protein